MAGEIKQTTAIRENRERFGSGSTFFDSARRSEETVVHDAIALPSLVTVFEDSTAQHLRRGTKMTEDAFTTFDNAFKRMMAREVEVEQLVKTHTAKMKDKMGQLADAVAKIEKLTGSDFDLKLQRLERFANAVETLDRLNRTGKLAEVSASLGKLA